MSDKTGISWTDATWNPIRGCSRVSEGCRNCYAEKVAHRFSGEGQPYAGLTNEQGRWNGSIKVVDEHLTDPLRWQRPRRVFVNSMSDLFHSAVPLDAIDRIFAVMAMSPAHTFQVLTKRPESMRAYLADLQTPARIAQAACMDFEDTTRVNLGVAHAVVWQGVPARPVGLFQWPLPNVWLGVSTENQATADARIPLLLHTPAAVRFISAEPLLGPIDLADYVSANGQCFSRAGLTPGLDWVIVGGESGTGARPCDVTWVRWLLGQCNATGVACFVKQLGAKFVDAPNGRGGAAFKHDPEVQANIRERMFGPLTYLHDRKGADMAEWPEDLRVQQYPEVRL